MCRQQSPFVVIYFNMHFFLQESFDTRNSINQKLFTLVHVEHVIYVVTIVFYFQDPLDILDRKSVV